MKYDYSTAQGDHKGGKGQKAAYETKLMRVPLPLADLFEDIISTYRNTGFYPDISDVFPEGWQHSYECKQLIETAYAEVLKSRNA